MWDGVFSKIARNFRAQKQETIVACELPLGMFRAKDVRLRLGIFVIVQA